MCLRVCDCADVDVGIVRVFEFLGVDLFLVSFAASAAASFALLPLHAPPPPRLSSPATATDTVTGELSQAEMITKNQA